MMAATKSSELNMGTKPRNPFTPLAARRKAGKIKKKDKRQKRKERNELAEQIIAS